MSIPLRSEPKIMILIKRRGKSEIYTLAPITYLLPSCKEEITSCLSMSPLIAVGRVVDPCFFTPLTAIHKCSASTITKTPLAPNSFIRKSAICPVSLSCLLTTPACSTKPRHEIVTEDSHCSCLNRPVPFKTHAPLQLHPGPLPI
jgi:hypothetical protein